MNKRKLKKVLEYLKKKYSNLTQPERENKKQSIEYPTDPLPQLWLDGGITPYGNPKSSAAKPKQSKPD